MMAPIGNVLFGKQLIRNLLAIGIQELYIFLLSFPVPNRHLNQLRSGIKGGIKEVINPFGSPCRSINMGCDAAKGTAGLCICPCSRLLIKTHGIFPGIRRARSGQDIMELIEQYLFPRLFHLPGGVGRSHR